MAANPFRDVTPSSSISGPPSDADIFKDIAFRKIGMICAILILALLAYILWEIGKLALPAMSEHGFAFITGTTWDGSSGTFGVLPEIWGTLYSSLLALIIGGFIGIAIAIFLTQDFLPPQFAAVFRIVIEL